MGAGSRRAGVSERDVAATGDNIPMALVGWVAGCTAIWSALFTVGKRALRSLGVRHTPSSSSFSSAGWRCSALTRTLWAASSAS
jgi:hypothetical protein